MSDKRQKNQLVLAFTEKGRSEAPKAAQEGTESRTAKCATERPASHEQLMEEVCERGNCWQAYKRVKANKGSPGIDGMKVGELSGYLKQHWPTIREQLLRGAYQPQPVRRVEIPKPDGGVRKLGIPTVLDRFIQQAVMQVLQRRWDPTSPNTVTDSGRNARRIKQWPRRSSTSPQAIAGWSTSTSRNSLIGSITTN
jgi:RNA-directed DNA polymerase